MNRPAVMMKIDEVLAGRARKLTMARALALSGGPFDKPGWPDKNLHTDANIAAETGLSAIVVSGTQWEGYAVGLLVEVFGAAWFESGIIDIKIPRSVKVDEIIQPKLQLQDIVDVGDHYSMRLKIWCENERGQEVLVGTASCSIPREMIKAST